MEPAFVKPLLYWSGMAIFFLLELRFSYRPPTVSKLRRWLTNIPLSLMNGTIYYLLFADLLSQALQESSLNASGLLHGIYMPEPLRIILGILLLDLSIYLWHLANHEVPILWRFHRVHHSDMNMDVSTANRFHLGEFLVTGIIRLAMIRVFGISLTSYLLFELLANLAVQFHHSSITINWKFEQYWRLLFVPPGLHRIHHSVRIRERDSNYGVILSIWDRFFRTLRTDVEQDSIITGIGSHRKFAELDLKRLLVMPFSRATK